MSQNKATTSMTVEEREEMIMIISMRKNYAEDMLQRMSDEELKVTYLECMDYE